MEKKKILGIVCGRKNGSTERGARIALLAAQEAGCDVRLINLHDLNIQRCTCCMICGVRLGNPLDMRPCPLHGDDMEWLDAQICESDGLLFGAPMYEQAPPGEYKIMCDRFGPSHDVNIVKHIYDARVAAGVDPGIDPRWFKHRPAAFFGLGGSEWSQLGYASLAIPAIPLGLTIVDKAQFNWNHSTLVYPVRVERLRQMGRHLAAMVQLPEEEQYYNGPEAICPICHNDMMILSPKDNTCTCALCGMIGEMKIIDGKITPFFPESVWHTSHVTDTGREIHILDMTGRGEPKPGQPPRHPNDEERAAADAWAKELLKQLPLTKPVRG